MVINHSFEEQLRKLISETQDELHIKETKKKELEIEINTIAEELQSYEMSLQNYLRRIGQEPEQKPVDWNDILKKYKTHKEKLIAIAERNNGELKISTATDILYNGKFIKSHSRANAYIIVYTMLNEMLDKEFERKERGVYRLKPKVKLNKFV